MSANDQVIVAPFPGNLEKYAVWHDFCVDNPFDFSAKPIDVFDTLEEAVLRAEEECDWTVEYGIHIITRSKITGYEPRVWDVFPEYKYLGAKYSKKFIG